MNYADSVILKSREATKNPASLSQRSFTACLRRQAFRMTILPVLVFIMVFLGMGAPAQAQGIPLSPLQPELREEILRVGQAAASVGLGERALENLDARIYAMRIVKGALGFVGLVFIIMILYAGGLWMTSGGGEERIGKAKKILSRAFIGMAIMVASYSITVFVQRNIVRATFQTMFDSAQNCTGAALASCCNEWLAFQNAVSRVPGAFEGAGGWEEAGSRLGRAYSEGCLPFQSTDLTGPGGEVPEQCGGREYRAWLDCTQRRRDIVEGAFTRD